MLAKLTRSAILLFIAASFVAWVVSMTKNGEAAPASDAPAVQYLWT
ncbi:MAG TPA: hypothetical protein VHD14_03475 [Pseudolabrys sp.]|jgi:hypothetical protein|nr:hypothetical protein [Pseudolabrys sp.]